ncbi:hypothetical protein FI667_g8223, partial [Globisporangium splendens]
MSARARLNQRVPQAEVGALSTGHASPNSEVSAHVGSFDDDEFDSNDDDDDAGDDDETDEMLKKRKKQKARSQHAAAWSTKLHALIWIVAAGSVAYAIDFFHVIFSDPRINKWYFHVGLICMGVNICITAYLAIYLPYIKRIHLEWNVYCPRMIPTAMVVGAVATFAFIFAFWPVWGLFTPGLLALFFIGSLMTAHFLPSI